MKPHPQTISIVRELRDASDDEIQRCAISQAREMTERLRREAPAACAAHLAAQEAAGILHRYGADLEKLRTYLNEI